MFFKLYQGYYGKMTEGYIQRIETSKSVFWGVFLGAGFKKLFYLGKVHLTKGQLQNTESSATITILFLSVFL